jgi:MFS family permease
MVHQTGLRANWHQFTLLVIINAFVGAMLGIERSVVPLIAQTDFAITSASITLSFIISFGVVKACANLFTGWAVSTYGRKPILVAGWLVGIPVPLLIIWAPRWEWVVAANILLGINQGLCWSTAVIMKIDLAGSRQRGLAMGLNEFAGYVAMSLASLAAGALAVSYGMRPIPFLLGIGLACTGFLLSLVWVRDRGAFVDTSVATPTPTRPFHQLFIHTSWQHPTLQRFYHAGLINNLNDVVIWGMLPLLARTHSVSMTTAAQIGATYLATWGGCQLATGPLSDRHGRIPFITLGMGVQAIGIALFALSQTSNWWYTAACLMGIGTAMVYPTLLAAVGDSAVPQQRAQTVSIYRFWRDSGYAGGALLAGIISDMWSYHGAIWVIAVLTLMAGIRVWWRAAQVT